MAYVLEKNNDELRVCEPKLFVSLLIFIWEKSVFQFPLYLILLIFFCYFSRQNNNNNRSQVRCLNFEQVVETTSSFLMALYKLYYLICGCLLSHLRNKSAPAAWVSLIYIYVIKNLEKENKYILGVIILVGSPKLNPPNPRCHPSTLTPHLFFTATHRMSEPLCVTMFSRVPTFYFYF